MNKIKPFGIMLIALCMTMVSCQESEFKVENLLGKWEVSSWEVKRTGEVRKNKMDMDFKTDKNYEINYGSKLESGKFWIANEFLHTVENNKAEKKVKILKLTSDTLKFQMNRAGEIEDVLMIRN